MPPKKVFVFAGSMDGGGSERQTLLVLQHLNREHWQPHLFLLYRRGVFLDQVPADVPIEAYWSNHHPPRIWIPGRIHRQQVAWLRQHLIATNPAAIYDRTFHATLITGPASAGLPVRRVSTITSPPALELTPAREKWARLKRWRLGHAYRSAHAVVAVSQAAAESAEQFYRLPKSSVHVIPNPVDMRAIAADAALAPPKPLRPNCFHIAAVGRMTTEKGHQVLLDALALLSQKSSQPWHLWLAGDGPLRPALTAQAEALGLESRVTFLGHVPQAARLIAHCQLLCLPSFYEGMPNVVMEAMAAGTPVLATDAGGTTELSGGGQLCRLVPPGNAAAMSVALAEALTDPRPWHQRAEAAKLAIAQRDVPRIIPRIEKLLG